MQANKTKGGVFKVVFYGKPNGEVETSKSYRETFDAYNRGETILFIDEETQNCCVANYHDGFRGTIVFARPSIRDNTKISRLLVIDLLLGADTVRYLPMTAIFD